jgi:hypothetical protein
MERETEDAVYTVLPSTQESDAGIILDTLRKFTGEFKLVRHQIANMDDDALIELYQQSKEISDVAWLIRAITIGTAKSRAQRGDGVVKSLAQAFGIGVRMAELDIQVYETYIKDNPDFEPVLPPVFYQKAIKASDPNKAIDFALEKRMANPAWPASDFERYVKGDMPREPAPKGFYSLMRVPEDEIDELKFYTEHTTVLFGKVSLSSIGGNLYAEIK